MEISGQDIVTALTNQRNAALNDAAQQFALLQAALREIAELKKQAEKPKEE